MTEKSKTKQTQFNDSITGVNPIRTHGFGLYGGRRVVWSVRVDQTLLGEAKPVLRAKFGSDCRGVEAWLAGLVATTKGEQLAGVYPSNTVEIGKLVIERNLRSRRKLVVEEEVTESKVLGCSWCHKPAVNIVQNKSTGQQAHACEFHSNFLRSQPNWESVKAVEVPNK